MTTRLVRIENDRTGAVLGERVRLADRAWPRMRGYLGSPAPQDGEGLLLRPCNGVHMFGMRYALDVVFVSRNGSVVRTYEALAPGRAVPWVRHAHEAIELPPGTIAATETQPGDRLRFEPS
ncbi:MAG: DUF192 domain-containing protein [Dehalococcoidia bacterium]